MDLRTVYMIAKNTASYNEFKEEIDYRIFGCLRTVVNNNEYAIIQVDKGNNNPIDAGTSYNDL